MCCLYFRPQILTYIVVVRHGNIPSMDLLPERGEMPPAFKKVSTDNTQAAYRQVQHQALWGQLLTLTISTQIITPSTLAPPA